MSDLISLIHDIKRLWILSINVKLHAYKGPAWKTEYQIQLRSVVLWLPTYRITLDGLRASIHLNEL